MGQLRFRLRLHRLFWLICLGTLLLTLQMSRLWPPSPPVARALDASQLVQTGVDFYQSGNFQQAIAPWQQAYTVYEATADWSALAIVSENLARAYQQMGQTAQEIDSWEQAIAAARNLGDRQKLGRLITEQAQAYSRLGQNRRAIALLCGDADCQANSALQIARETGDAVGQVAALGSLGEAYRLSGDSEKALNYLEEGYRLSQSLGDETLESSLLNSLGNALAALAQVSDRRADEAETRGDILEARPLRTEAEALNAQAIAYFQQSYAIALTQQNTSAQVRSLLGLISAYKLAENPATAQQNWELAQTAVQQLPASQTKAFTLIKLTNLLEPLALRKSQVTPTAATLTQATALLNQAIAIGETIKNPRVISFGLGELGNLYERAGRYGTALEKTQQARLAADQDLAARESLYLWEWQIGRIYKAQNKLAEAEQAYAQAIALLEQIRSEILNANRDLQFDFRDMVEPIYRQYAELNLSTVPEAVALTQGEPAFADLDAALVTLDSLKVAELQSYFASDCVIVPTQTRADAVGQSTETAVLSTAIAADQLTVILSLPDGSKKTVQAAVSQSALREQINAFRKSLEFGIRDYRFNSQPAQQIYRQLIQPFEADLVNVKTLVFVNDGLLRSVPMAALYAGQQFLIERFAIATTPSLTLTNPEKSNRQSLNALLLGVSEPSEVPQRPFAPLPAVEQELAALSAKLPNSEVLLNQDFSIAALQQKLATKDYRILHMATHGTFGFAPEDNFVVVGAKRTGEDSQFNQTLTIGELDQLIRSVSDPTRSPIELLTITACETAIGDNRSTLGLAGVAVRAGVRSAVATLWSVSDESTAELITNFYENLKDPSLTKAEALQRAQVAMLRSDDVVKANPYRPNCPTQQQ